METVTWDIYEVVDDESTTSFFVNFFIYKISFLVYSVFWFFNVVFLTKTEGEDMNILLVEDYRSLQFTFSRMLKYFLGEETNVLIAGNKKQAREIFAEHHPTLDLILMDLNLGIDGRTFDLIQEFSTLFQGSMVAISSDTDKHTKMLECGCTHACDKMELDVYIEQRRFQMPHF